MQKRNFTEDRAWSLHLLEGGVDLIWEIFYFNFAFFEYEVFFSTLPLLNNEISIIVAPCHHWVSNSIYFLVC